MEDTVYDLLVPTLSFGAVGAMTGSVLAVSRAKPISRYMVATSLNFTLLGGSFIVLRKLGLTFTPSPTPDRVWISTAAGAVTGGVFNAMMRGSKGIMGAILVYGGMGGLGEFSAMSLQSYFTPGSAVAARQPKQKAEEEYVRESEKSVWRRLKESSPLRPIPDQEFETMMSNKIRDLDEQIRLVDEELANTRAQVQQARSQ